MDSSESIIATESEALSRLRTENATLTLQKENAQLAAEIRRLRRGEKPTLAWWKNGATVSTLTAILAAAVLLTTAVHGWARKTRELALEDLKLTAASRLELQKQANALAMQREKQTDEFRTAYLDRLKEPGERLRSLRFVLATADDERLRSWAIAEQSRVEQDLRKLEAETRGSRERNGATDKVLAARPERAAPARADLGRQGHLRAMLDLQQIPSPSPANASQRKQPEAVKLTWEPVAL
jgi:hypothetical protein